MEWHIRQIYKPFLIFNTEHAEVYGVVANESQSYCAFETGNNQYWCTYIISLDKTITL